MISPSTRDKAAALPFMKKAPKRHGAPQAITTDGLRYDKAAMADLGNTGIRAFGHSGIRRMRALPVKVAKARLDVAAA